jgi:cold shock CspA family protein
MRTRGRYVFYSDVVTILKGKRARGIWWARGRRIPQLPVLVHSVAMRASGLVDLAIGEHIEAEVAWGPSGATAYRLRRGPQARSLPQACKGIDRIMIQLRRR